MSTKELISIVVPVYNVAKELARCFDSIIGQTYAELEIILVDDGSTDGSGKLCDCLAKSDPRTRVIHKKNGGLSSARNAGLGVARGDWLLYVDSDDVIEPDACEGLLAAAQTTGADFVLGDAIHETPGGAEEMLHNSLDAGHLYAAKDCIVRLVRSHQFYAPAVFALYRTAFLLRNRLLFKEGILHEDMEFQPRLYLAAQGISYSGKTFYRYIDRASSIMNAADCAKRAAAMKQIYTSWKKCFDDIDDGILKRTLYGHLAKCYLWSCRTLGDLNLEGEGVTWKFLFQYGLDAKERAKALIYGLSPSLWEKL